MKDAGGGGQTANRVVGRRRSPPGRLLLIAEGDGPGDVGADRVALDQVSVVASTCNQDAIALVPRDRVTELQRVVIGWLVFPC